MTIYQRIQLEKFLKKERAWDCFRKNIENTYRIPAGLRAFRNYMEEHDTYILKKECRSSWKIPRNSREKYGGFSVMYWYDLNKKFNKYLDNLL